MSDKKLAPHLEAWNTACEEIGLLREKEAADVLRMKRATLARWRWNGTGPIFVKLGGTAVRYRLKDLRDYIEAGLAAGIETGTENHRPGEGK